MLAYRNEKLSEQRAISNLLHLKLLDENEYARFQTMLLSSGKEADAVMLLSRLQNPEQCATMMKIFHEPAFGQAGTAIMEMLRAGDLQAAGALKLLTYVQTPRTGRPALLDLQSSAGLNEGLGRTLLIRLGSAENQDLARQGVQAFGQVNNVRLLAELFQSDSTVEIRKLINMLNDKQTHEEAALIVGGLRADLIRPMLSILENPELKNFGELVFYNLRNQLQKDAYDLIIGTI